MKRLPAAEVATVPTRRESFTEGVLRETLVPPQVPDGTQVNRFIYPPGGHSHWHVHGGEQSILVEQGRMRVRSRDGTAMVLEAGDALYLAPGEVHWHGATPDRAMVHLALNANGPTDWVGPVDDEDYAEGF